MINEFYTYQRIRMDDKGKFMVREDGSFDYFLESRSVHDISGFSDAEYKTGILFFYNLEEDIPTRETRLQHMNAVNKLRAEIEMDRNLNGGEDAGE